MKPKIQTTITYSIIAIAIALAISHGTVISGQNESCTTLRPGPDWTCRNGGWLPPGYPAQDGQAPERSLEGGWLVTITPRICATGAPIPTAAFEAYIRFTTTRPAEGGESCPAASGAPVRLLLKSEFWKTG